MRDLLLSGRREDGSLAVSMGSVLAMSVADRILWGWGAVAGVWWLLAVVLVSTARRRAAFATGTATAEPGLLSCFKALPPVARELDRAALAEAVGTWVMQLDEACELLVGIPHEDAAGWQRVVEGWRRKRPGVRIRECRRETPRQHANPKIGWYEALAAEASGEYWLWSDADIVAAPGTLGRLRSEMATLGSDAIAVTAPYCVRSVSGLAGLPDALFVNLEFLPGAVLLGRFGPVRLSFGAAVLFRRGDFAERVSWRDLGASLADDYVLGQQLAPVQVSRTMVETLALQPDVGSALRHLHRWQRTIRWCRPGSFAALLVVMPVLGWAVRCTVAPTEVVGWLGLGFSACVEVFAAILVMRWLSVRMPARCWVALAVWPAVRAASWLAAWLPLPVVWGNPEDPWRTPVRGKDGGRSGVL
jgi:ceramide glucosyltransferase